MKKGPPKLNTSKLTKMSDKEKTGETNMLPTEEWKTKSGSRFITGNNASKKDNEATSLKYLKKKIWPGAGDSLM
jgi:hypothetical protein